MIRRPFSVKVFPASAGMIPVDLLDGVPLRGVPRKRGDDPLECWDDAMLTECSPQARG